MNPSTLPTTESNRPDQTKCPPEIVRSLSLYRDEGVPPGSFLQACLANDLTHAVLKSDAAHLDALPHIVAWMYWQLPAPVWGSRQAVEIHLSVARRRRELAHSTATTTAPATEARP